MTLLCCCSTSNHVQARPIRDLGLLPEPSGSLLGFENPGPVPPLPATGELVVQKAQVQDTRLVRAFVLNPSDGRMDSWNYAQFVSEYDDAGYVSRHWELPTYEYIKDPGVHMTLPAGGFNYLYLRGGFEGPIYRDVDADNGPGHGQLLTTVKSSVGPEGRPHFRIARVAFDKTIETRKVTFFRRKNLLGDAEFYRIGQAALPKQYTGSLDFHLGERVADITSLGPDFVRLPAINPEDQHVSTFERRFFRATDRAVYALERNSTKAAPLALVAQQQAHFLTPALPPGTPIGAVRLHLKLAEAHPGSLLNLAVQDPLEGGRELLRIDVRLARSKNVDVLLDFPDQIMAPGRRFWITLAFQQATVLQPDSQFKLLTVAPTTALDEYIAYRLYLVKGLFSPLSEARPWTNVAMSAQWLRKYDGSNWQIQKRRQLLLELFTAVEQLHDLAPGNSIVNQYYSWLTRAGKPMLDSNDVPPTPQIAGVPRWAVLMDRAIKSTLAVPSWWFEHRQAENGEFGCFLSDDTDFVQWWPPLVFMGSDAFAARARRTYLQLSKLILENNLRDGVSRRTTDPLHSYEEGTNHMSVMPLLFYGDPRYVEWLMTSARTTEKWMHRTPNGLNFRTNHFGWQTAQKPPEKIDDVSTGAAMLLHPDLMLGWYNHNPRATEVLTSYADNFGGYMDGGFGSAPNVSFAAYWLTGQDKYLGLPQPDAQGQYPHFREWSKRQGLFPAKVPAVRERPWWDEYRKFVGPQWSHGDWAWSVEPNRATLEKSLEFALWGNPSALGGGVEKYFYIWTAAEMIDDRIFLPIEAIAQPMLGGYSTRNRLWPAYAVSYEHLDGDFAALVLDQGRDKLKVAMVNLRTDPREGLFRVWMLDPGQYELKIGPDANNDGVMDRVESTRALDLKRMSPVTVSLPARRLMIYELHQLKAYTPLDQRCDVAISADDVGRDGANLKVTVHNIGAVAAENVVVAVQDAHGKVLASTVIPRLEAPLDLMPKTAEVSLPASADAATVVLDPQHKLTEITEANNTMSLAHRD
jgi:hypothetical protein